MTPSSEQDELLQACQRLRAELRLHNDESPFALDIDAVITELTNRLSSPSVPEAFNVLRGIVDIWDDGPDGDHYKPGALREAIEDARRFLAAPPLTPSRSEGQMTTDEAFYKATASQGWPPSHHSGAVVDALRELVALKDLKDANTINGAWQYEEAEADYTKRKRMAWENARLALRHPSSTGAEE